MTTDAPTDPNAALWASLRPPPPPPWHQSVREWASELSLPLLADRIGNRVPPWVTSRWAARHWLTSTALGLTLGLGLGFSARPLRSTADGQHVSMALGSFASTASHAATQPPAPAPSVVTVLPAAAVASVSADGASADAQLTAREPSAPELELRPPIAPRVARAKPSSRAQSGSAMKKRARPASAQRADRSRRASKATSNPRTMAAYLRARTRANRLGKHATQ